MKCYQFKTPALMIVFVGFAATLTFSPFEFSRFHLNMFLSRQDMLMGLFNIEPIDLFNNVLFFIPWGLILAHVFQRFSKKHLIVATSLGLLLSLVIETTQLFLERSTSVIDLITNSSGTALGYWLGTVWFPGKTFHYKIIRFFRYLLVRRTLFIFYVLALAGLYSVPIIRSNFNSWNDRFRLYVGNEGTKDRPWSGDLYEMAIYARALQHGDVERLELQPVSQNDSLRLALDAVALYPVDEGKGDTLFASNQCPFTLPLVGDSLVWVPNGHGLQMTGQRLGTTEGAGELTRLLQKTNAFSVEVRFKATSLKQKGPARIITMSDNTTRRNFMLGQSGQDLYFRVRNTMSGNNGSNIQLKSKNALPDSNRHHVVATYNRGVEKMYVDGQLAGRELCIDLDYLPRLLRHGKNRAAQWAFLYMSIFLLTVLSHRIFQKPHVFAVFMVSLGVILLFNMLFYFWLGQIPIWRFWIPALFWVSVSTLLVTCILDEHSVDVTS